MEVLGYVLGVVLVVVGVGVSIALHELGHLVPAKRFGVKCTQYMIGFGPTIWARRSGDTEYGVKAIPLGGYVRMVGMIPPRAGDPPGELRTATTGRMATLVEQARRDSLEEVGPGDEDRVFYKLSVPKKLAVMSGGPLMNLALAVVLLGILVSGIGQQTAVPLVSTVAECVPSALPTAATPQPQCRPGDPRPPAAVADLRPGDRIVEAAGVPVATWQETTAQIRASAGRPLELVVERDGQRTVLTAPIAALERAAYTPEGELRRTPDGAVVTERVGFLGVSPTVEFVPQPITAVPGIFVDTLGRVGSALTAFPAKLVGVARAVVGQGERDPDGPISVVGVGRAGGELTSAQLAGGGGVRELLAVNLGLLFGLNLMLFLFNLVPLLPLDGGQIVGALWEGVKRTWARVRGRPDPGYVDVAKGLPIAYAVSTVFIVLTVLLVYADLVMPIRLT